MKKNTAKHAIAFIALITLISATSLTALAHDRDESATSTAENLMYIGNRNGNLGQEIRRIAKEHASSTDLIKEAKEEVQSRGGFKEFLFGTDYKNTGMIRSEIAKIDSRIEALRKEGEKLIEWDRNLLEDEIHLLEEDRAELAQFVEEHEESFSLFGWFVRLFN